MLFDVLFTYESTLFGEREIFMNTGLDAAIRSALSVANLIADALLSPQVAAEIGQQPQHVAAVRGLDTKSVIASASLVEKGQKTVRLGYWY